MRARLTLQALAAWLLLALLLALASPAGVEPCSCTTDTDCMQQCGGDGSPD